MNSFSAIIQLNQKTIQQHSQILATSDLFPLYNTKRDNSRKGKLTVQTICGTKLLCCNAKFFWLTYPSGLSSTEKNPAPLFGGEKIYRTIFCAFC
eukprot:IDg11661t1